MFRDEGCSIEVKKVATCNVKQRLAIGERKGVILQAPMDTHYQQSLPSLYTNRTALHTGRVLCIYHKSGMFDVSIFHCHQELPGGYGRIKPDIVTYGSGVRGSSLRYVILDFA